MDWIVYFIAFIICGIAMYRLARLISAAKQEEPVNKVRFYVARDKDGTMRLYIGKPIRRESAFVSCWKEGGKCMGLDSDLRMYGLNENDYADITWECEPLEVFVNMDD